MGVPGFAGDDSLAQRAMQSTLLAPVYERAWRPALFWAAMGFDLDHYRSEKQAAVDSLRLRPGARVLDLACGPGAFTRVLGESVGPNGRAVGVDLSAPMLQRARRDNATGVTSYLRGSGHQLPFADGSLDAVLCYGALYLIPDPFRVLEEISRVVAPGGRVSLMASASSRLPGLGRLQAIIAGPAGLRVFDRDDFTGRLEAAGFVEIDREVRGLLQYVTATRST